MNLPLAPSHRVRFLHYPVDDLALAEILEILHCWVKRGDQCHQVSVMNANKMYLLDGHQALRDAVEQSSMIIGENAIYFGCKWIKRPLKEKNLGGITVIKTLLEQCHENQYRFFFLGSTQAVIDKMKAACAVKYPKLNAVGWHHGYFDVDQCGEVIAEIRNAKPDILFTALGSPRQELWVHRYRDQLEAAVAIGVGGSFEVIAGIKRDAPRWTKNGLEWLYRSFQDPKKFKRYFVVNTYFVLQMIKHFLKAGH